MADEQQTPTVDPAIAQFVQQQAAFNQAVGQTLQKLETTLPKLASAASAPKPQPVQPADYQKANEAAINEFVNDPVGFSGKLINIATQQALQQARAEQEQKLQELEMRQYAKQVYDSFFNNPANQDVAGYQEWIAGQIQQMPGDWPVERKLVEASNHIRQQLSQRDDWVARQVSGNPNMDASAAGGRPAAHGPALDSDGVPMDENSLHTLLSSSTQEWKAARRRVANHDDYRRRGGR
jgi:hypothetical protein